MFQLFQLVLEKVIFFNFYYLFFFFYKFFFFFTRIVSDLVGNVDPVEEWVGDLFTVSANLAGLPAISVPVGKDGNGMPISMQVIGRRFADSFVLSVAEKLQKLVQ